MPVTLKIGSLRYKKPNGEYGGFDALGRDVDCDVTDVQIDGVSVVQDGVANVPVASYDDLGLVKISNTFGINIGTSGVNSAYIRIYQATDANIKSGAEYYRPITPYIQHESTFYGLAKAAGADMKGIASTTVGTYPEAQKSTISTMLNAPETVSGTTPSISALPGIQYICGEVSTLDITLPASGCIDVVFESGATPTVLTVTPPTGVTVKWANGFDPTALEANTTYEINIKDGLGVGAAWT